MKTTNILTFALLSCYLQILPIVHGDSASLLVAWENITINYETDIEQSNFIYYEIQKELGVLSQLRNIVERHLRVKNAEILVNALSSNETSASDKKELKYVMEQIIDNYETPLVDNIVSEAIDEIILSRRLSELPVILWHIYENNDDRLYEIMLRFQAQLYSKFTSKYHNEKKEFLENFAYKLYKIKQDKLYNFMPLSLKARVQYIVDKLPSHLQYLYFNPYFCLQNAKYEKYIYTAVQDKIDLISRYIWLWNDTKSMDSTGFLKAEEMNMDETEKKLRILLKGTNYQLYYYMMPDTKKVAGWDSSDTPRNHIWDVEFLQNDKVVFSQNDYLMCAIELHDNERRNVGGRRRSSDSSPDPECQWHLGKCDFL